MLDWIAANQTLLIAVFGTGGAGAVLLAALVNARRGGGGEARTPSSVVATANGGVAAAHGGNGDMNMSVNEAVGRDVIDRLQGRLGVSLTEAARLLKAFEAAGIGAAQGEAALARVAAEPAERDALVTALREGDVARAAVIVSRAAERKQG